MIELENIAIEEDLIVVELERESGLYPMNDKQAKRLCSSDNCCLDNTEGICSIFDSDNDFSSSEYIESRSTEISENTSTDTLKPKEILKSCLKAGPTTEKSVSWIDENECCDPCSLNYCGLCSDTCSKSSTESSSATYFTVENSILADQMLFWHKNWNHASKREMISYVKNKIFTNIPKEVTVENISKHLPLCHDCPKGNMNAKPVPQTSSRVYKPGEYCVGDTKYMTEPDINGNIYLTVFTDRGSDKTFGYLHKKLDNMIDLIKDICNQYKADGHNMKVIGLDSAFMTREIAAYLLRANLKREKINQEFPAPHEHAQNGKAENLIQKLENNIIKVLADSKSPKSYWGPIVMNAIKVRNSLSSKKNPSVSRNEVWGLDKVDLNATPMIPFGSSVLAHVNAKNQPPLADKCFKTISVGSADGVKGGLLLRNLVTSRNIIGRTFKVMGPGDSSLYDPKFDVNIEVEAEEDDEISTDEGESSSEIPGLDRDYIELSRNSPELRSRSNYMNYCKMTFYDNFDKSYWKIVAVVKENKSKGPGSRTPFFKYYDIEKHIGGPKNDCDFEYTPCAELLKDKHIEWDDIKSRDGVKISTAVSMGCALRVYRVDFKEVLSDPPPKNIDEARVHPEQGYFGSFLKEIDGFHKKKADIPADIDIKDIDPNLILQLIPIFQKKFSGADFEKFKCRMVVLGNHWKNINGTDTSASMVGMDTLKLVLALGASLDMDMVKFDIKEAYLSTDVEEADTYYTRRPPGVRNDEMAYIMKPACFIYGHPLANKKFRALLIKYLTKMGAKPSNYDVNLYILDNALGRALIPTIVDDMPTMYSGGVTMLNYLKEGLSEIF